MSSRPLLRWFIGALVLGTRLAAVHAEGGGASLVGDLQRLVQTPAVPGYEQQLAATIAGALAGYHPHRDSMGNVLVTLGTGAPRRLLVAPMDEPGFVVSHIDAAGYLRLQRLPQSGLPLHYNELHTAQPMLVGVAGGKTLPGSMAGLSIHLQPGRQGAPSLDDLNNLYVDVGARSAGEAEAAGVHLLGPVAEQRELLPIGEGEVAARAVGDRFGDAVLVDVLRHIEPGAIQGTLTVAFVAQQWTGARGLTRVLEETTPDELIYVGRALPAPRSTGVGGIFTAQPGTGPWLVQPAANPFGAELERAGAKPGRSPIGRKRIWRPRHAAGTHRTAGGGNQVAAYPGRNAGRARPPGRILAPAGLSAGPRECPRNCDRDQYRDCPRNCDRNCPRNRDRNCPRN